MKQFQDKGQYTAPDKTVVKYDYEYEEFEAVDIDQYTGTILALANRQAKVDANNRTREKTKSLNGHSTTSIMSPEAKAKLKEQQAKNRMLLKALKANPELLAQLGVE